MSPKVYLKEWRLEKGLSYRQLVKLARVALSSIQDIEAGKRSPTVEILDRLAIALEINFHSLFEPPRTQKHTQKRRNRDGQDS